MPHSELLAWSDEDRSKMMAFLLEESARCQNCGTSPWEWEEDPFAYEAVTMRCEGCARKEFAREDAADQAGTRIALVPKVLANQMAAAPKSAPRRRRSDG
jgi:hypothetical protein